MRDAGIIVDSQSVYGTFVAGLPSSENEFEIRELSRKQVFDREEIINVIQAQYDLLSRRKKSSPAAHALVADGRGGGGGRGHPGGKRGGHGGAEAVTTTGRSRSSATETTTPRATSHRERGRCVTTATTEVISPATAQ